MEIGHGFARPGRVTDLVRSSHAIREKRGTLSRIRRNPFNNETSRTKLGAQKFRLILKYNPRSSRTRYIKQILAFNRPRTRNPRPPFLPPCRSRESDFEKETPCCIRRHSNMFLTCFSRNENPIMGQLRLYIRSPTESEKEIPALKCCTINIYKYCTIKWRVGYAQV